MPGGRAGGQVTPMSVELGSEWLALQKKLKGAADGKAIRKAMNKRIREATKPIETDLQAAILLVESSGGAKRKRKPNPKFGGQAQRGGKGLRVAISKAIHTKITTGAGDRQGIRIRINGDKLPPNQRGLPKFMDGIGRLRKPVFGNREVWVTQTFSPKWWQPVIDRHRASATAKMRAIFEDVESELTR